MKNIAEQTRIFVEATGCSQAELARASGVRDVIICRLLSGKTRDVLSAKADALRKAMREINEEAAEKALNS